MEYRPTQLREASHHRERIVHRFTAMDHDGPAELCGRCKLSLEELMLSSAVGEIVVVIQSHLADGDDRRIRLKVADRLDVFGLRVLTIVRMNANGAADVDVIPTELD